MDVPGLSTILPPIPPGNLIVIEGQADPARYFLCTKIAADALADGLPVRIITSGDRDEMVRSLKERSAGSPLSDYAEALEVEGRDALQAIAPEADGLLLVDSFTLLTLEEGPVALARRLRALRREAREQHGVVLLGVDRGLADPRCEGVAALLADGLVQFLSQEGPEGAVRYLRIPKWTGSKVMDQNIHYAFDGHRLVIDLRKRVL